MADQAAAAPAGKPASKPQKKRGTSRSRKDKQPSTSKLILEVMSEAKNPKRVSMYGIKQGLKKKGVDVVRRNRHINFTVRKLVTKGLLKQVKGKGASGSFGLVKSEIKVKVKRKVVKKKKKPPGAKGSPAKKPRKPAAKRLKGSPVKKRTKDRGKKKSPKKVKTIKPKMAKKTKKAVAKRSPAKKAIARKAARKPVKKLAAKKAGGKKSTGKK